MLVLQFTVHLSDKTLGGGGGGVATQKNRKKPKKKPVPNLKFAVAFGFFSVFWYFSVFFGILWYFFGFFGLNFDKKFQPIKNHVNNEILGGQELPNNTLDA